MLGMMTRMESAPSGGGIEGIGDLIGRAGEDTRSGLRYATRRLRRTTCRKGPLPKPSLNLGPD
jgi:hypothetical protein